MLAYWLELFDNDEFELRKTTGDRECVCKGRLSDIGVEEDDEQFSNKMDDFFEKEIGIKPEEWEIG